MQSNKTSKSACKTLTVYVNCNTTSKKQTGDSWKYAYSTLDSALKRASDACTKVYILIASGVYVPSENYTGDTNDKAKTFYIPNNTYLIGGFSGTESNRKESCSLTNETVLSGMKYYWNVVTVGDTAKDPMRVTSAIENLTIAAGNGKEFGGGVYARKNTNLKLQGVSFRDNTATLGGALYSNESNILATNCRFAHNNTTEAGGAIFSDGDAIGSLALVGCTFVDNTAAQAGGAVAGNTKNSTKDCTFAGNASGGTGGAFAFSNKESAIEGCVFRRNTGVLSAGAVICDRGLEINNCTFDSNTSLAGGGAVTCGANSLEVYNSTFTGNTARTGDGGAVLNNGQTTVTYCKFGFNKSLFGNGGALASVGDDKTTLDATHVKFKNNKAPNGEGDDVYINVTTPLPPVVSMFKRN